MIQLRPIPHLPPDSTTVVLEAEGALAAGDPARLGGELASRLERCNVVLDLSKVSLPDPSAAAGTLEALHAELVRRAAESSSGLLWVTGLSTPHWNHDSSVSAILKLLDAPELADGRYADWLERRLAEAEARVDSLQKSLLKPDHSARRERSLKLRMERQAAARIEARKHAEGRSPEAGVPLSSLEGLEGKVLAALASEGITP